ncbi:dephospho-CoA kinase [Rickettsiella grylli]|uniref:Dephospho-CoA kinase n=1 Tax=Rickettsiella grylli TaxID=59196 RepID=A8PKS4_9COXI|nr:dephospho-CoA kinase [Rickettsiella grylli]EDP46293.1 dephospho-CoA kinase [Rickettsiella grylli]
MFTVALTGGIASGKSTVARYFAEFGINIVDADQIGRELVDHDATIREKLVSRFGHNLLKKNNKIDRDHLRTIIFNQIDDREWLEELLHPLIYWKVREKIKKTTGAYCLAVIPLLLEGRTSHLLKKKPLTENYIELNRILLVTTTRNLQIQRAKERDFLEKDQIDSILNAQISSREAIKQADDIIYNESDLKSLYNAASALHKKYLSCSMTSKNSLDDSNVLRYYLTFK